MIGEHVKRPNFSAIVKHCHILFFTNEIILLMAVSFLSHDQRKNYYGHTGLPSRHDLSQDFYLDDTDHALIVQKRGAHTRLCCVIQLGTVRYPGAFLEVPLTAPSPCCGYLSSSCTLTCWVNERLQYLRFSVVGSHWQKKLFAIEQCACPCAHCSFCIP